MFATNEPSVWVGTGCCQRWRMWAQRPHTRGSRLPAGGSAAQITVEPPDSGAEEAPGLAPPEVVERRQSDVGGERGPPGQEAPEAEQPARHPCVPGLDQER